MDWVEKHREQVEVMRQMGELCVAYGGSMLEVVKAFDAQDYEKYDEAIRNSRHMGKMFHSGMQRLGEHSREIYNEPIDEAEA